MSPSTGTIQPAGARTPVNKIFTTIARLISTWALVSGLLYLKIPTAFTKIYAEDGAISLQDALAKSFPDDFLSPYAGYFDIIGRSAGSVVSSFPIQNAAQVFFFFNTLMLSWIATTIYLASTESIPNRITRSVFSLSLILLPIASFESIANTTNLHFFFMSACLPIFLRKDAGIYETYVFSFFVLVATLSTPLMIFFFPLIVFMRWNSKSSSLFTKPNHIEIAWLIGIFMQVLFIITQAFGDRTSTGLQPITKTGFLYLDRVVGSSFFPWWGNVSDSTPSIAPNLFSTRVYLALRALLALILLCLLVLYIIKSSKRNAEIRTLSVGVLLTGFVYWFVIGLLFSPEPRYAIFPSFGLLLILFYIQGEDSKKVRLKLHQRAVLGLILLTWLGSWSPSELRINGPTWATEYKKAQASCLGGVTNVRIPIIPTNLKWYVIIECEKVLSI